MDTIEFNALLKEAHELRNTEIRRIMSGASSRIYAFGKVQIIALRNRLSHLTRQMLAWNPRAHPFH